MDTMFDQSDVKSMDSAFSMDSGMIENDLSVSVSTKKLFSELERVKDDLKSKDKEIRRVTEIRENTDREIEDLATSLFESAHSMVEQAKIAQATAEKKLKNSNQTIEALTLENIQLKKAVGELKQTLNTCRSSSEIPSNNIHCIDNVLFREFSCWEDRPTIDRDSSLFLYRIYAEDIRPCLTFPNAELSARLLEAIERNDVIMELCQSKEKMKNCSLMGDLCVCDYRIRLSENAQWSSLSALARNRIVAVCDFFTFIRHVQAGLVKSDAQCRFSKIIELRKRMAFARLGL